MANTTFSGPIRSENNVQLISKTASTGVVAPVIKGCLIPLNKEVPSPLPLTFVTPLEKCVVI